MHRRYLLLHGSWHGAWCWFKVAPRLRRGGEVVVPDLPGRGRMPAWAPSLTLPRMVRAIAPLAAGPVPTTIVVHSRYGVLATALAEAMPHAIRRVVYLAAYLLPSGARARDAFAADVDSLLRPHVEVDRLRVRDRLHPVAYREGLYADCCDDEVELARALLCAEPSLPALARVRTTDDGWGRVPKAYIRLTQDRAVSIAAQDRMLTACPVERVESLHASHSAYFSQPDALVASIERVDAD